MRARTSTPDDAKRVTMQVSTAGIVCNAALTVFKLVAGIVAHSSAIVSDILGSLIVMIGAVFSHKAADASHPYGHEKLECIASILLGNILVVVGAAIGYAGVMKIIRGETLAAPGVLALIAAVVSIVVKEGLYWYTIAAAKRIRSVSLKAEAWHHRSDALSSIGSFAGVLGARLGMPILDPIASIVICLFIFKVAYGIFHESIDRHRRCHARDDAAHAGRRARGRSQDAAVRQPDVCRRRDRGRRRAAAAGRARHRRGCAPRARTRLSGCQALHRARQPGVTRAGNRVQNGEEPSERAALFARRKRQNTAEFARKSAQRTR